MSAVEGADTTAALRARLDQIEHARIHLANVSAFDALRAVLDLCESVTRASNDPKLGPVCVPRVDVSLVEQAIADALGVQREGTP